MLFLLLYLFLPLGLFFLSYLFDAKLKRWLRISSLFFLCLPMIAAALIFILRTPIQRGKILPAIGPLLNFISPPEDLFTPLASAALDPTRSEYVMTFSHKYVGKHELAISFPSLGSLVHPKQNLKVSLKVMEGVKRLLEQSSDAPTAFWGDKNQGLVFISYRVPDHLPVDQTLSAMITVTGDIHDFARRYGPATIILRKGPDL